MDREFIPMFELTKLQALLQLGLESSLSIHTTVDLSLIQVTYPELTQSAFWLGYAALCGSALLGICCIVIALSKSAFHTSKSREVLGSHALFWLLLLLATGMNQGEPTELKCHLGSGIFLFSWSILAR
jgi:hypothetical protein